MLYLLRNIQIFEARNKRGLYHWLRGELFNDKNIRMNSERRVYYSTSEDECQLYMQAGVCIRNTETSTADVTVYDVNDTQLKKELEPNGKLADFGDIRHIKAAKIVWPLNGVWARIYRQDVKENGVLVHRQGDLQTSETGQIMEYRELVFYVATDIDPDTGDIDYGQDPQSVANRILERGYVKLETTPAQAVATQPAAPAQPEAAAKSPEELQAEIEALKAQLG